MRPLNYSVLKYMTSVPSASAQNIVDGLKEQYGKFKMLNHDAVLEALMTAEQNGLLEKEHYELDKNGKVHIYFRVTEYGVDMIEKYIK